MRGTTKNAKLLRYHFLEIRSADNTRNIRKYSIRILNPTCMANRIKIHKGPVQTIAQNRKSSLIKIDMLDMVDLIKTMTSYASINCKSI